MRLIKLFVLSLFAMVLTACGGGDDSGLPSQGGGGEALPAIVSLQVTPAIATVPVGLEQQYVAEALLEDGSVKDVTTNAALSWRSSNPAIATIDSRGLATGVSPGDVTITASGVANGVPIERSVSLTVSNAVVTELQVTPANSSVPAGLAKQFIATAYLSDGSTRDVTNNAVLRWSTDAPSIATISNDPDTKGQATGVAPGDTTITASGTANGQAFSAAATLTVTDATVVSLTVTPFNRAVPKGLSRPFTATAVLSDGSTKDVTNDAALSWSTSDPAIATISSSGTSNKGLATGVAEGSVTITASGTVNGTPFSATQQLTVTNAIVTSLQITPATANVPVGLAQQFTAIATLSDNTTHDVTNDAALSWSSSNPSIATITSTGQGSMGLATGVDAGTVTITASGTANGQAFSATGTLTVTNAIVTRLQVTPFNRAVPKGLSRSFTATAVLSDGSTKDVTNDAALSWSSSDPGIATIISNQGSGNGVASGVAPGTVAITASGSANGTPFSATQQLTVTNAIVTGLQITPPTASVPVGLTQQFTAMATLSDSTTHDVTNDAALSWSSSDPRIATITSTGQGSMGLATGVDEGAVTITASGTANGQTFSATGTLTVTNAIVTSLQVSPQAGSVPVGLEQQYIAIATLSDNSQQDVTNNPNLSWISSNPTLATIDNHGLVTGVNVGQVTITASGSIGGTPFNDVASLEVTSAVVTELTITPPTATIAAGTTQQLQAKATLSDGSSDIDVTTNTALNWFSSNTDVATIDRNGLVTGVSQGFATMTAMGAVNGQQFNATAQVRVITPTAFDITPKKSTIKLPDTTTITASLIMSDGSKQDVTTDTTFETSDVTTATMNGNIFTPVLYDTSRGIMGSTVTGTVVINGVQFQDNAAITIDDRTQKPAADSICAKLNKRLPTYIELQGIFNTQTSGGTNTEMCTIYNWPLSNICNGIANSYMSSDADANGWKTVDMTKGVQVGTFGSQASGYYHCVDK